MIREKIRFIVLGGVVTALGLIVAETASTADFARGMLLYQSNCMRCHGEQGDGKGPEAANFVPKPMDFTSSQMSTLTDALLEKAVVEGVSTVPSHAWGNTLSKNDVAEVLQYIRTFRP